MRATAASGSALPDIGGAAARGDNYVREPRRPSVIITCGCAVRDARVMGCKLEKSP